MSQGSLAKKRLPMVALALLLCAISILMLTSQGKLPVIAFAEEGQATTKDKLPVVQFAQTAIAVQENESFEVAVLAQNWDRKNTKDLKVHIELSDPEVDIVNTKITSARRSLLDMRKQGIIMYAAVNGSRYLTAAKERTAERDFYILNKQESTPLCMGGYYSVENTGDRTVTVRLRDPADGKGYTVGANDTLTITFTEVDQERPIWNSESKSDWVEANLDWLRKKFPAGTHWNHFVGNSNDPDGVTSVPCQNGKHGEFGEITSRMGIGSAICNNSSYSVYVRYEGQDFLYIDQKDFSFIQCVGYAMSIARDIFGTIPYNGDGWKTYSSVKSWKALEAGDYVRISGHSFFIIGAKNGMVTVTECNVDDDPCVIFWDSQYRVSEDGRSVSRTVDGGSAPFQKIESVSRMMR